MRPCRIFKLPDELLLIVFEYLGPASQRISGATCRKLRELFLNSPARFSIYVYQDEISKSMTLYSNFSGTTAYSEILIGWLAPKPSSDSSPSQSPRTAEELFLQQEQEEHEFLVELGATLETISSNRLPGPSGYSCWEGRHSLEYEGRLMYAWNFWGVGELLTELGSRRVQG